MKSGHVFRTKARWLVTPTEADPYNVLHRRIVAGAARLGGARNGRDRLPYSRRAPPAADLEAQALEPMLRTPRRLCRPGATIATVWLGAPVPFRPCHGGQWKSRCGGATLGSRVGSRRSAGIGGRATGTGNSGKALFRKPITSGCGWDTAVEAPRTLGAGKQKDA